MADALGRLISFDQFWALLPLVTSSLVAGALLGIISGVIGPMIQARDLAFAVHGTAELSFAGAAAALLAGVSITLGAVAGSVLGAIVLALMGIRARQSNSLIGIVLPFGLGLGVLFLSLYDGRSSNKFGLLLGQIVSVDSAQLGSLAVLTVVVGAVLIPLWRPMFFAAVDPVVAQARGVRVRELSLVFMVVLGLVCAMCVQLVGALLVMALLITPTAAATCLTARPALVSALSVAFAVLSMEGGILLSLSPGRPISPYVTTLSFLIYLVCRAIGSVRTRRGWSARVVAT